MLPVTTGITIWKDGAPYVRNNALLVIAKPRFATQITATQKAAEAILKMVNSINFYATHACQRTTC